jgi:cyclohexyl-isocyanide hydratase
MPSPSDTDLSAPRRPYDTTHLGVLLFPGAEPLDALGPAQVFWTLGEVRAHVPAFAPTQVHLVAERAGPVELGYGLVVNATVGFADVPALDVLVVPGGSGGDHEDATARRGRRFYERHEPTLDLIRRHAATAPITASVCTGAFLLAGAGLLAGRRAATQWAYRDELVAKMAARGEDFTLEPARVVEDGPLVTAGGVSSGIDSTLTVVARLFGKDVRDAVALGIELDTPT